MTLWRKKRVSYVVNVQRSFVTTLRQHIDQTDKSARNNGSLSAPYMGHLLFSITPELGWFGNTSPVRVRITLSSCFLSSFRTGIYYLGDTEVCIQETYVSTFSRRDTIDSPMSMLLGNCFLKEVTKTTCTVTLLIEYLLPKSFCLNVIDFVVKTGLWDTQHIKLHLRCKSGDI